MRVQHEHFHTYVASRLPGYAFWTQIVGCRIAVIKEVAVRSWLGVYVGVVGAIFKSSARFLQMRLIFNRRNATAFLGLNLAFTVIINLCLSGEGTLALARSIALWQSACNFS